MWKETQSTEKPLNIDDKTSRRYVYVRRNVRRTEETDTDGEGRIVWSYEENAIPRENYELYKETEQNRADIAFLSMMTEVDV